MAWYNCWLAHKWSRWSVPREAYAWFVFTPEKRSRTMAQERTCFACGEVELREAA